MLMMWIVLGFVACVVVGALIFLVGGVPATAGGSARARVSAQRSIDDVGVFGGDEGKGDVGFFDRFRRRESADFDHPLRPGLGYGPLADGMDYREVDARFAEQEQQFRDQNGGRSREEVYGSDEASDDLADEAVLGLDEAEDDAADDDEADDDFDEDDIPF